MTNNQTIEIFPNACELFNVAAEDFMQRAITAVSEKGVFSVVLSGGNTPKLFFDTLTSIDFDKKTIPWQHIQFFFGDERYVAPEKKESNYHTAYKYLFHKVPVLAENIFRIPTEFCDPKDAAKHYEDTLRKTFNIKESEFPPFDVVYLGLGDDAHTASLMPFTDTLHYEKNQLVAALWVEKLNMYRITLTPAVINNSMDIIFLVTGANKELAVRNVLQGHSDPKRYPAQLIHCLHGKTIWYLDQLAAGKLKFINS